MTEPTCEPSSHERANNRPVLKCGDMFVLFESSGEIRSSLAEEEGLYFDGTRFLSARYILLNGAPLSMLGSQVRNDGEELLITFGNCAGSLPSLPEHSLFIAERIFLAGESCYSELWIKNYSSLDIDGTLSIYFAADYADIYEVRGMKRITRGTMRPPEISAAEVLLGYDGLDKETRSTHISFDPAPSTIDGDFSTFHLHLSPGSTTTIQMAVACKRSLRAASTQQSYAEAHASLGRAVEHARDSSCSVRSSNTQFNAWWNRSTWDLQLLTTTVATGKYPYAGVPWFNTPFGRDGLITGLETLWIAPELARGVLAYLAATQATVVDPMQDAEPGKILHETRSGEMAALHEMPFGRYYGTVDGPPLFVFLAGAYLLRSGDTAFIRSIWDSIVKSLEWISTCGDSDDDGFLEYESHCEGGLIHQAWKDSDDAIFHANGETAVGALAICEVQGYCFAAYRMAAEMASALHQPEDARRWQQKADGLYTAFNRDFWCDSLKTYGIALDGKKSLCCVSASNAGQLLLSGIVPPERAALLASSLMNAEHFSGWGVRTLSHTSARFNPMSYHNGSVWPHDNAVIAYGLSLCGLKPQANTIFQGIFDAALRFPQQRLPELFCGFEREEGYGPIPYPVACSPQAWSAGAASLLLQASLGIEIDGRNGRILFHHPTLPDFLKEVHISNLSVGDRTTNLVIRGERDKVSIAADGPEPSIEIIIKR